MRARADIVETELRPQQRDVDSDTWPGQGYLSESAAGEERK